MLQVSNVSLQFGARVLFKDVTLKFNKGNCYGVIGANGAGKSTFLRILSGDLDPNKGEVIVSKQKRISVLSQDQNEFDAFSVVETVLLGHARLVEINRLKDELYSKEDFTEEDGIIASQLEEEFAMLDGWSAESNAAQLLNGLGVEEKYFDEKMKNIDGKLKVKVLLAKALFGNPDILILDEPTNNLDIKAKKWIENFLLYFENTVIVVSHDRHFLNKVCTHICDVDFGAINIYVGNYDFWYETSQLVLQQAKDENKKMETRIKELEDFIARFSANASKSKQATSRKKELEKITLNDIKPSNRRYPFIDFRFERNIGNDVLEVNGLTKEGFFNNISFRINKGEKVAFISENSAKLTMLFKVLSGEEEADSGTFKFGQTIIPSYLPSNNDKFFKDNNLNLIDWLKQYSTDQHESFIRSWLGRMLFSGDEALKKVKVLSGGEKVRCMLARAMLNSGNLMIMDDPSNHLDLETITALNKGMINYRGVLLFSSNDHEILQTVGNRIIEITEDGMVDRLMTYDEYIEKYK